MLKKLNLPFRFQLFFIFLSMSLFVGLNKNDKVVLDGVLNARSTPEFSSNENLISPLGKGTEGVIQDYKKLANGMFAIQLKITKDETYIGENFWFYYNPKSPKIKEASTESMEPEVEAVTREESRTVAKKPCRSFILTDNTPDGAIKKICLDEWENALDPEPPSVVEAVQKVKKNLSRDFSSELNNSVQCINCADTIIEKPVVVKSRPPLPALLELFKQADILANQGKLVDALETVERGFRIDPRSREVYRKYSQIQFKIAMEKSNGDLGLNDEKFQKELGTAEGPAQKAFLLSRTNQERSELCPLLQDIECRLNDDISAQQGAKSHKQLCSEYMQCKWKYKAD